MTPQTRALIEAAEKHISHCRCGGTGLYAYNPYLVEPIDCAKCSDLRAAISSAKAAEEGVETEHCPRCRSAVRGIRLWVSGWTEPNCKHEWHDSVREKEGL